MLRNGNYKNTADKALTLKSVYTRWRNAQNKVASTDLEWTGILCICRIMIVICQQKKSSKENNDVTVATSYY